VVANNASTMGGEEGWTMSKPKNGKNYLTWAESFFEC